MPQQSRDLFDDTTMTFGEHLEALRFHLWKAIIGLVLGVIVMLAFGTHVVAVVRKPIDDALRRHSKGETVVDDVEGFDPVGSFKQIFGFGEEEEEEQPETDEPTDAIEVKFDTKELARLLEAVQPDAGIDAERVESRELSLTLRAPEFVGFKKTQDRVSRPVTLNVQEAFMTYMKVSFVAGLVLSSPWVFWQIWLFVAAGLYPHERKYVYVYLPISLGFFLLGGAFCFYLVFPFVLDFLLQWNEWLGVSPQIRLSEWISFALMLPVMFGISFQLPLVMMFLERIDLFDQQAYRERRRLAILVIAFLSMMLTPADPTSMLLMMFPLIFLYELGIIMCGFSIGGSAPVEPTE